MLFHDLGMTTGPPKYTSFRRIFSKTVSNNYFATCIVFLSQNTEVMMQKTSTFNTINLMSHLKGLGLKKSQR